MTKQEAVKLMVERDFTSIPLEWVQIVAEKKNADIYAWPMWGTMWQVDSFIAERLAKHTHVVNSEDNDGDDEEMNGAEQIADTASYLYEIDGVYLVGVHGAGWNFYDGVWDVLYDLIELKWHDSYVHEEGK